MAEFPMTATMQREIHINLREKEVRQQRYRGASPFASKRAEFIDWIHDVADKFRLRYTSAAAAIAYLDVAMDFYGSSIDFYELQVLTMACLMVGAKMEEQEPDIPLLTQVIKVAGLTCTMEQLSEAELMILKAWDWNVCVVTPNHFIDMYSRESALDDMVTGREQALEHIDRISEYATEVARLASRDDTTLQFRPSVLATATVVCARTMLKAEPHYSASLRAISAIDVAASTQSGCDLGLCCELLLRLCVSMEKPLTSPVTAHAAAMEGIVHSVTSPRPADVPSTAGAMEGGPIRWPLQDMTHGLAGNYTPGATAGWPTVSADGGHACAPGGAAGIGGAAAPHY